LKQKEHLQGRYFARKGNLPPGCRGYAFTFFTPLRLSLAALLQRHQAEFGPVLPVDLNSPAVSRLDLSASNAQIATADLHDTAAFTDLVNSILAAQNATIGIGGYLENRVIYRRSAHFGPGIVPEARSLHLGVDVWLPAGTSILAPLPATIHSLADNDNFGDYGPTVILQHELEGTVFYSLYGHLSRLEWRALQVGQPIAKGESFATVGPYPENGDWPPHLHFQLIADMQDRVGDYPGVAPPSERDAWAALCPDPNLVLQCQLL
jgi:murein DD-endopeptidase MepM/ murein hydrolase activator NlpD